MVHLDHRRFIGAAGDFRPGLSDVGLLASETGPRRPQPEPHSWNGCLYRVRQGRQRPAVEEDSLCPCREPLLASFVWHHPHDGAETAALLALESIGTESHPALFQLVTAAKSVCTIREAAALMAAQKATGAYPVLIDFLEKEQHEFEPMEIPEATAWSGGQAAAQAAYGRARWLRSIGEPRENFVEATFVIAGQLFTKGT